MWPRSQVLRSKAQRHRRIEWLHSFHLPVEPLLRVRTEPISPAHARPQITHAKLLQPLHAFIEAVVLKMEPLADAEPLRKGRRLVLVAKHQPCAAARSTGVRETARKEETRAGNWGPSRSHARTSSPGKRPAWTKQISRRKGSRGADEVIVVMTLRDNITRGRAKDLWAGVSNRVARLPLDHGVDYGECSAMQLLALRSGQESRLARHIRHGSVWGMRDSRLIQDSLSKVAVDCQLEAVLGKTRRTEF